MDDLELVKYAPCKEDFLNLLPGTLVDIFLIDIHFKEDHQYGIYTAMEIQKIYEKAKMNIPKIIFLTGHNDRDYLSKAAKLNCSLLSKELPIKEIIKYIKQAHKSEEIFIRFSANKKDDFLKIKKEAKDLLQEHLSPSQGRVATCMYKYETNQEIAAFLNIAVVTVQTHLTRAYKKLKKVIKDEQFQRNHLREKVTKSELWRHLDEIVQNEKDWFGKNRIH
ncbi:MAG: LuxR C-terminal-related transcriptional regulator [Bacteroidota bacterium]